MINSKGDLEKYMAADLKAARPDRIAKWRYHYRWKYPIVHWLRNLRRLEFLINCKGGPIWSFLIFGARLLVEAQGRRLGFSIGPNVFGPGLSIPHWGTIVINRRARVGARCRLHACTNIGDKNGVPTIGDDCYIGPGAKLFGPIVLGDHVSIGANAVVNRSFGDGAVLVGVPARDVKPERQGA
jgi:serine O-acetyltransferase